MKAARLFVVLFLVISLPVLSASAGDTKKKISCQIVTVELPCGHQYFREPYSFQFECVSGRETTVFVRLEDLGSRWVKGACTAQSVEVVQEKGGSGNRYRVVGFSKKPK